MFASMFAPSAQLEMTQHVLYPALSEFLHLNVRSCFMPKSGMGMLETFVRLDITAFTF
jgi:hypothetical protein